MELNISFSELEMMVAMLEYCRVLHQMDPTNTYTETERKHMQVCQDLLSQCETGGGSFLDCIFAGDAM